MDSPIGWQILLQLVLIGLNAIFACAEIAVISMDDARIEKLAQSGNAGGKRLRSLTSQPARFLATIQVAITLSGFLGSAFAADNFAVMLTEWATANWPSLPRSAVNSVSVVLITLILSYFTLIFGELVPKRLAQRNSERIALGISGLISTIAIVFKPIVWLLTISTNGVLRLMRIDPNEEEDSVTEENIRMMVDVGSEKGAIDDDEKEFIQNVFEFDDLSAGEIATHRTDVEMFDLSDDPSVWAELVARTRYSFYPVCNEDPDDIVGVIEARDYLLSDRSAESVKKLVKPAYFVPDGVKADVLFKNMRTSSHKFAIVLDEFGGFEGIITLNDLVTQLVGDLNNDETPDMVKLSEDTWRIAGTTLLDDIASELDVHIEDEDSDTLSGLIFSELGSIPKDGAKFDINIGRLHVRVTDVQEHRVISADVTVIPKPENSDDDEDGE